MQESNPDVKNEYSGGNWKVELNEHGSGTLTLDGEVELGLTPPEASYLDEELSDNDGEGDE